MYPSKRGTRGAQGGVVSYSDWLTHKIVMVGKIDTLPSSRYHRSKVKLCSIPNRSLWNGNTSYHTFSD